MRRVSNRAKVASKTAMHPPISRRWGIALCALVLLSAGAMPVFAARSVAQKKQIARTQFENAERMREALNGRPAAQRRERDYVKVIDAYRRVYYTAPTSSKADPAIVAVAELLVEEGRAFHSNHTLEEAIGQYEFLRKEYPGSKYRVQALFTIAQIYKDDLGDNDKAKDTLQEFLKRYPHSELTDDARQALKDIDDEAAAQAKKKNSPKGKTEAKDSRVAEKPAEVASKPDLKSPEVKAGDLKKVDLPAEDDSGERRGRSMVTGVRHWSTPDYTRIAIDLEDEVKYSSDRISHPNRIYFDLKDTRLSSVLKGKEFDVDDGYLKKIRVAQFAPGLTRVVLEVGDDVSEYSAFLLPNPYRLVIDIHGKKPAMLLARGEKAKTEAAPKAVEAAVRPEELPTNLAEKPVQKEVVTAKLEPPKAEAPKQESGSQMTAKIAEVKAIENRTEPKTVAAVPAETKMTATPVSVQLKPAVIESKPVAKAADPVKKVVENDDVPKPEVTAKLNPPPLPRKEEPPIRVRGKKRSAPEKLNEPKIREAQPTSDGDRSLIRALGLKIGRIVIDAGHGGHDTGTIGPNGVREKDIVLDVALKLGKLLEDRLGAEVVYTRDDDTFIPLETRTAIANQQQADLFISIHANSSDDPSARGVETYYLNFTSSRDALEVAARENAVSEKSIHELQDLVKKIALKEKIEESRELAVDIQQSLHAHLAAKAPAIRDRGVKKAPF
ncbi:MAG: N-acetylmuramoyl-L-alanine amidase, partial [Terriglobales bacterium]